MAAVDVCPHLPVSLLTPAEHWSYFNLQVDARRPGCYTRKTGRARAESAPSAWYKIPKGALENIHISRSFKSPASQKVWSNDDTTELRTFPKAKVSIQSALVYPVRGYNSQTLQSACRESIFPGNMSSQKFRWSEIRHLWGSDLVTLLSWTTICSYPIILLRRATASPISLLDILRSQQQQGLL